MSRTFSGVELGSIEIFLRAAEALSFSKAANTLGLSPPAVSRTIGRLEARLGIRLFARTTRQVALTDEGRLYYELCRTALAQIADAEDILGGRQKVPTGHMRISVPTTYGHYRLLPLMPEFTQLYPQISLEINVSNRNVDFVEEGYDLAIRLGEPVDNRLVARTLENATLGVFASPRYFASRDLPRDLDDLAEHSLISFTRPSTGRAMPWLFKHDNRIREWAVKGNISCSDDVLGCVSLACAGSGLFQIYHFIAATHVHRGELVEILPEYAGATRPFSLVYPQNRHLSAKIRALVGFLRQRINNDMTILPHRSQS